MEDKVMEKKFDKNEGSQQIKDKVNKLVKKSYTALFITYAVLLCISAYFIKSFKLVPAIALGIAATVVYYVSDVIDNSNDKIKITRYTVVTSLIITGILYSNPMNVTLTHTTKLALYIIAGFTRRIGVKTEDDSVIEEVDS